MRGARCVIHRAPLLSVQSSVRAAKTINIPWFTPLSTADRFERGVADELRTNLESAPVNTTTPHTKLVYCSTVPRQSILERDKGSLIDDGDGDGDGWGE